MALGDSFSAGEGLDPYLPGYPRFFPDQDVPEKCATGYFLHSFQKADMIWINQQIAALNSVLREAAGLTGATYVDTHDAFDKHEICGKGATALFGVRYLTEGQIDHSGSFHPTALGQRLLAQAVTRAGVRPPQ